MKLMPDLVAPPDDKALYRSIATMAIDGDKQAEKKAAAVQLFEDGASGAENPSKGDIAKIVAALRSRLASVDMGRFSVSHNGGALVYVTVNDSAPRKRAVKKAVGSKIPAKTAIK